MNYLSKLFLLILINSKVNPKQVYQPLELRYNEVKTCSIGINKNEIVEGAIGFIVTNEDYQYGDIIHIF